MKSIIYYLCRIKKAAWFIALFLLLIVSNSASATTYTVTNNNPNGAGSLDQAIDDANSNPGADIIVFNIPGSSVAARTITLTAHLPDIDEALIIDGTTQPNGSPFGASDAKIIIDGAGTYDIMYIDASNVEIYGLYIKNTDYNVVKIRASGSNCIIGSDKKGNIISGNTYRAIALYANNCTISHNFIGVDSTGTLAEGNDYGIYIYQGSGTLIDNNIISGNFNSGIRHYGSDITISNNKIGVDISGTYAIANTISGISFDLVNSTDLATVTNNIISGNSDTGIHVKKGSLTATGNIIGTDIGETLDLGNSGSGIYIKESDNSATANITNNNISYNLASGIYTYLSGTIIKGNYIGTNSTNTLDMGNTADGVHLSDADNCIIGGYNSGDGNYIAYNGKLAICVDADHSSIIGNSLHHNKEEGVDLVSNGDFNLISQNSMYCNALTAGQPKGIDIQSGNGGIQKVDMTTLTATEISGTSSTANGTVELFVSDNCGLCMGRDYLQTTTADGSGNWSFSGSFDINTSYVLTITDANNNTSEFNEGQGCEISLPVTLIQFDGQSKPEGNLLYWSTSAEINNDYFVIEKSSDAVNFHEIGKVLGSGNSNSLKQYTFTDDKINLETNYYRLVQVDYDGTEEYFNIISVIGSKKTLTNITVQKLPSQNLHIKLDIPKGEYQLSVYDNSGKLIINKRINVQNREEEYTFNKPNLRRGLYLVLVQNQSSKFTRKVIL